MVRNLLFLLPWKVWHYKHPPITMAHFSFPANFSPQCCCRFVDLSFLRHARSRQTKLKAAQKADFWFSPTLVTATLKKRICGWCCTLQDFFRFAVRMWWSISRSLPLHSTGWKEPNDHVSFPLDKVCKRPWNFERVPNSIIQGNDRALIFTSTKEACLAACLNEVCIKRRLVVVFTPVLLFKMCCSCSGTLYAGVLNTITSLCNAGCQTTIDEPSKTICSR